MTPRTREETVRVELGLPAARAPRKPPDALPEQNTLYNVRIGRVVHAHRDLQVKKIDGRTVDVALGKKTLRTADAVVKEHAMGFRYRLLGIISNPNIAYILMILGFYGL